MKLLFRTEKYKRYQRKKQRKAYKRREKRQRRKKHLRRLLNGKPRSERQNILSRTKLNDVKAPEHFSLLHNTEESIGFLSRIESFYLSRKGVFVVLKNVKTIDHSAITVLLSLMYKFKLARIDFNGNFPDQEEVKKKLIDSQFFEKLMKPLSSQEDYVLNKENQIFARANKFVVPEMGLKITEEASETIWGEKRVCKGLQRTLIELMQNTNNHASDEEGEVHWWLSVNHDKAAHLVDFYFVDYGQGILGSLGHKSNSKIWNAFWVSFSKMIESGSEPQVIESLLNGEHRNPEQRKHPYYRGKGLPSIRDALDRKQISNLHIISNNTFADVGNKNFSRLGKDFNGTFIHWQLGQTNISEVWNL